MSQLDDLLTVMVEQGASDLHIKAMRPPLFRKDGILAPIKTEPLRPEAIEKTLMALLKKRHLKELEEKQAVDVGYSVPGVSRFRGNIFVQRGTYGAVFRAIPIKIPQPSRLGIAPDHPQIQGHQPRVGVGNRSYGKRQVLYPGGHDSRY